MKPKKLLSLFLAVALLLSMLPAAAFGAGGADLSAAGVYSGAGEDLTETSDDSPSATGELQGYVAITAFDPISLDAGKAGTAAYADAAAVSDYLSANYASVTARTYGGGAVAVPVTGWEDTDTYDPAAAGSYTFTAVLGEIPAGYANAGNVTAAAAVVIADAASLPEGDEGTEDKDKNDEDINDEEGAENEGAGVAVPLGTNRATVTSSVYEITGFAAIADLEGGTTDAPAYADAAAVIAALPAGVTAQVYGGGTVDVPVIGWTDTDSYDPATAGSYTFRAELEIPTGYALGSGVTDTVEAEVVITDPDAAVVEIPDVNLKMAVCAALKKPSDYNPTLGDMKSLTSLDASDWGITDLTGLWTAVNLETLDLSGNLLTANVTSSTYYSKILDGIEALTKLRELDLADCDLGIDPTNPGNTDAPNSVWYSGVNYLENLEKLDLSGNHFKGSFLFSSSKLANLKELDFSDNQLYGLYLSILSHPKLERIDISGNYIYLDESEDCYPYMVEMGVEKFVCDNMKNRADLYALRVTNAGVTTRYYMEDGQYVIDAGTLLGGDLTFTCHVFSSANTVKVTLDGQKYTAGCLNSSGTSIPLSGLELDKEHEITFEVMHLSQDTRTYTLKLKTKSLISGPAGIKDVNLQKAVCTKLGEDFATYGVTIEDMQSLTGSLSVAGVTDTEGVQYATGLTGLSLTGTFASLPDLSGLTNITSLTVDSPNLTAIPSLANQAKVKTLTIKNAASLIALPDVTGMTALTTITLTGGSNLALPEGLSGLTNFITLSVTSSNGFNFTGLGDTAATSLTLDATESFTLPASAKLKTLKITNCGLTVPPESLLGMTSLTSLDLSNNMLAELPASLGGLTSLTILNLSGNKLTDIPDLSGLTALATLTLTSNSFTDIPENVTKLKSLTSLLMSNNPISIMSTDLSPLSNLQTLVMNNCGLTQLPESLWTLSSLKTLNLQQNKLSRIDASMAGLTSLTTLDLNINQLEEFPAGIKDLPAIQTLKVGYNFFTDLPAELILNTSSTELTTLKSFIYGGRIKYAEGGFSDPAPGTVAVQVEAALLAVRKVNPALMQAGFFSELKTLDSSLGAITQIHDALNPTDIQEYTLTADEGTTSITLTPTAMLEDSTITVNGTQVANGSSIEIPLQKGLNTISIVCYNEYIPNVFYSHTTTYNLKIYAGSSAGGDFPAAGKTYSIGLRLLRQNEDTYSMADSYFKHSAEFTYDAAQDAFVVDVTVTKHSWITEMSYMDESGAYVPAERVAQDTTADTAVYRIYVKDLEADLYISPWVVPMGYAPICRIIFDTGSIIDITDEEPEPGDLADGQYTIDADALKEYADEPSMTNQFLTEPAQLTVVDGQITLTMVWHGTSFIPMTMVEGLWYQNSAGEFVEITRNIDSTANTLTFSMPLAGITEPTMMQVYAPEGMGETYPKFRLVFNEETLTPVTEEERAVYTLTPVEDQVYQAGITPDGIHTMTVNPGFSGLKYFGVQVTPVTAHSGEEAVVFTHQRDGAQLSLNVTRADFDSVPKAQAGFNVLAGDEARVYIVDDLTNDPDTNPILLQ